MRRQLSTYIDPDAHPADRKLSRILDRESVRHGSLSRAIHQALLEHFGVGSRPATVPVLPGMENVHPGTVTAQRDGLATVSVGGRRLFAASLLPPRTRVFVSVRAHSIALQTRSPSGETSMRNALPARVRRVVELDEIAYVDLDAGRLAMRALVTPASVRDLHVRTGVEVIATFKALSVKLTPR